MTQASSTPTAQVPSGASHVHVAYDTVTFYKRATYGHGVESGQPFVGWHSWTDGRWLLEHYARSDRFVPVSDWLSATSAAPEAPPKRAAGPSL